jgi:hypothetical protein
MKKRNFVIHCFVLLTLIATLAACATTPTREGAGEYTDDSVITNKVKALLAEDDFLKSLQISVETYQGTVLLSGFVNSHKDETDREIGRRYPRSQRTRTSVQVHWAARPNDSSPT